jgi:hypothetical protein
MPVQRKFDSANAAGKGNDGERAASLSDRGRTDVAWDVSARFSKDDAGYWRACARRIGR